ncbi:7160_t:CDS:1, partial [Entrophospora sp. SA101]
MGINNITNTQINFNNNENNIEIDGNLLKIANHNVMGMKDPVKQEQIINTIETLQLDVLGLSETNLNNRTASHIYKNNKNYSSFWSCSEDKPI